MAKRGNPNWVKGVSANPDGKKPGTKNRLPRDLVERILAIEADLTEKNKGLKDCAESNPQWFLENFIKPIIPKNIDVNMDGELKITWEK